MDSEPSQSPQKLQRKRPAAIQAPAETRGSFELSDSGSFREGFLAAGGAELGVRINPRGMTVTEEAAAPRSSAAAPHPVTATSASGRINSERRPSRERSFDIGVGDFELLEAVGTGNSGHVRKALYKPRQCIMALKIINVFDPEKRKQLLKEIQMLYDASSPRLITFHGAYFNEGAISIALEYMTAGSLQDMIKLSGGLPETIIALIAEQMIEGLAFMHKERHEVHRDLKPSNLLLDHSGFLKLTDFGVSAALDDSIAKCATFVGTYLYMSPERLTSEGYGDIWSLGVVLMECATGEYAWQSRGYWDLLQHIVHEDVPTLPETFSTELRDLVSSCLIKDPNKRPDVITLLSHPFITKHCAHLSAEAKVDTLARWIGTVRTVFYSSHSLATKTPEIAREFSALYYSLFASSKRHNLDSLYTNDSVVDIDDEVVRGRRSAIATLSCVATRWCPDAVQDWSAVTSSRPNGFILYSAGTVSHRLSSFGAPPQNFFVQKFEVELVPDQKSFFIRSQQFRTRAERSSPVVF